MKSRNSVRPATEVPIGTLAEAAGVNVETIRYYQRRGLVDEPNKPLGGHRRYPKVEIEQLVQSLAGAPVTALASVHVG